MDLLVSRFEVGVGGGEVLGGRVEIVLNLLDFLVEGVDLVISLEEAEVV